VGWVHALDQAIEAGEAEGKSESEIFRNTVGRKQPRAIPDSKPSRHAA